MRNGSIMLAAVTGVALIIVLAVTECNRSLRPLTPPGSVPSARGGEPRSAPASPPAEAPAAAAPKAPDTAAPGPGAPAAGGSNGQPTPDPGRPDGQSAPATDTNPATGHPARLPTGLTVAPIAGASAELEAALAEASPVTYRIVGVGATNGQDRTELLDAILAANGWPEADQLVLVVFTRDGHDLRFAMGGIFREREVEVNALLQLVRSEYQPRARQGDPAGGLAALIRAVNRRVQ